MSDPNNRARVLMGFQNAGYREYTYATDLALIDDSGATTADAGQSVILDATVQNIGPRSANRVVVTRRVPAETRAAAHAVRYETSAGAAS